MIGSLRLSGRPTLQSNMASVARDMLAPIYDWFNERSDTLDLKQAKALLDRLA
jgi:hypothetical protein